MLTVYYLSPQHVQSGFTNQAAFLCTFLCFFSTFLQDFLFLSSVSSSLHAPPRPVLAAIHKILDLLNRSSRFFFFSYRFCFQFPTFQPFCSLIQSYKGTLILASARAFDHLLNGSKIKKKTNSNIQETQEQNPRGELTWPAGLRVTEKGLPASAGSTLQETLSSGVEKGQGR